MLVNQPISRVIKFDGIFATRHTKSKNGRMVFVSKCSEHHSLALTFCIRPSFQQNIIAFSMNRVMHDNEGDNKRNVLFPSHLMTLVLLSVWLIFHLDSFLCPGLSLFLVLPTLDRQSELSLPKHNNHILLSLCY